MKKRVEWSREEGGWTPVNYYWIGPNHDTNFT